MSGYQDDTGMGYGADSFMSPPIANPPKRDLCESCGLRPASCMAHFGDGTAFKVCDECRPFDPATARVVPNTPSDPN